MVIRRCALLLVCTALAAPRPSLAKPSDDGVRVHQVERGQVLGAIAKRYGVSVEAICRASAISPSAVIKPGQRLVIPAPVHRQRKGSPGATPSPNSQGHADAAAESKARAAPPERAHSQPASTPRQARRNEAKGTKTTSWATYRKPPWRRGYVTLFGHGKQWKGYVIGPKQEVLPLARRRISETLASWRTGQYVLIDARLIQLIADVSDTFGGRPIRVVSGYREHSHARNSKHREGRAFDFSVPGVPNEALRDYLRSLPNVGVGFYPNSTHVHLDVRDRPSYWIDYSRPGQAPRYGRDQRVSEHRSRHGIRDASLNHPSPTAGGMFASDRHERVAAVIAGHTSVGTRRQFIR